LFERFIHSFLPLANAVSQSLDAEKTERLFDNTENFLHGVLNGDYANAFQTLIRILPILFVVCMLLDMLLRSRFFHYVTPETRISRKMVWYRVLSEAGQISGAPALSDGSAPTLALPEQAGADADDPEDEEAEQTESEQAEADPVNAEVVEVVDATDATDSNDADDATDEEILEAEILEEPRDADEDAESDTAALAEVLAENDPNAAYGVIDYVEIALDDADDLDSSDRFEELAVTSDAPMEEDVPVVDDVQLANGPEWLFILSARIRALHREITARYAARASAAKQSPTEEESHDDELSA